MVLWCYGGSRKVMVGGQDGRVFFIHESPDRRIGEYFTGTGRRGRTWGWSWRRRTQELEEPTLTRGEYQEEIRQLKDLVFTNLQRFT